MPHTKWSEEERLEKIEKFANVTFKFVYMIAASYAGISVLFNQPWMPPMLRSSAFSSEVPLESVWVGFPRDHDELSPALHVYYMVELGYALHSLLFHMFLTKHRNDFWEMMIHHFAAIVLILFSYLGDCVRVGTLVLIVHDIPDIFVYGTKVRLIFRLASDHFTYILPPRSPFFAILHSYLPTPLPHVYTIVP